MNVHQRIKDARESRGLTYQQFGDAVGVSRGAVQQWEKGDTAPTRKNQPAVAKFMGLSVAELMADTDQMKLGEKIPPNSLVLRPNQAVAPVNSAQPATDLIANLRNSLRNVADKEVVGVMLAALAKDPDNERVAQALQVMLEAFAQDAQKQA